MRLHSPWLVPIGTLALVLLDQLSKMWVQHALPFSATVTVVDGFLHVTYRANHGAVAGIGRDWPFLLPLLIAVGMAMAGAIAVGYWLMARLSRPSWQAQLVVMCCLTPLLCTVLDRARQGYVVDFIHVGALPIFNLADVLGNLGILVLALQVGPWLRRRRQWARAGVLRPEPGLAQLKHELWALLNVPPRDAAPRR